MHPSTSAKQREREALKAAGWSHHELWLSPQDQERFQTLRSVGDSFYDVISRALELAVDHPRYQSMEVATPSPRRETSQYLETRPTPRRKVKRPIDWQRYDELKRQGLDTTNIAKVMGIPRQTLVERVRRRAEEA